MSVESVFAKPSAEVEDVVSGEGIFSSRIIASLRRTRPWVLVIAILGFLSSILILLTAVPLLLGSTQLYGDLNAGVGSGFMMGMGGFYLGIAVVTFFASWHLVKFAAAIKRALNSLSAADLEDALERQASFWKLVGILSLLSVIFALVAVFGVAFIAVQNSL